MIIEAIKFLGALAIVCAVFYGIVGLAIYAVASAWGKR